MTTTSYSKDQIIDWLQTIEEGEIDLMLNNMGLARSALKMIEEGGTVQPSSSPSLRPGYISPNFTFEELTYSATAKQYGISNIPNQAEIDQLTALANVTLEGIRKACGGYPVMISSGFRSKALNDKIGGAKNSAHLYGCAADLVIPDFGTPNEICHVIMNLMTELEIDQLIDECDSKGNRWVHVGRAIPPSTIPRKQELTVNANGTTTVGIA